MATVEERLKILKLIEEGKISAEDGAQLLEVLDVPRRQPGGAEVHPEPVLNLAGRSNRWFRVKVTDTNTGKMRVNVRLPLGLVNAGLKMGAKFAPEVQGLDMDQLAQYINSGEVGQVVDVYDDQDGEHVEVFIE